MRLPIHDLSAEEFAPFGQVICIPDAEQEAAGGPGWHWWGARGLWPAAPEGCSFGMLRLDPQAPLCFTWAERHANSPELLAPLGNEVVIHVAPAEYADELGRLPEYSSFQLFRVRPGQAVVFHPGVWHGAPLAPGAGTAVLVMQQQGTGGSDNTAVVPFDGQVLTA